MAVLRSEGRASAAAEEHTACRGRLTRAAGDKIAPGHRTEVRDTAWWAVKRSEAARIAGWVAKRSGAVRTGAGLMVMRWAAARTASSGTMWWAAASRCAGSQVSVARLQDVRC